MRGVIILPKYLEKIWTPKITSKGFDFNNVRSANGPIFYYMKDVFGFDLRYADEVDIDSNTDILLMWGVPYHNRPELIPGLMDVSNRTKLIIYPGDIQCYDNQLCLQNKDKVFTKADLIISGSYEYFSKLYPQFLFKTKFFPNFFAPHQRYIDLPYNEKPKLKCLLSGSINPKVYVLRNFIKKQNLPFVDYRKPKYAVGDSYAKLLNSYSCCVTCSSVFNYAISKYFEIPASGSLLIANETMDSAKAGFIPNKHYIPITKSNAIETISSCLKNPNDYEHIRKEGMKFVRENHSINNRMEQLQILFQDLLQ